jgi:hypothetical protein
MANPEARGLLRHAATMAAKEESDFLATNPEIEASLRRMRAAAPVGK